MHRATFLLAIACASCAFTPGLPELGRFASPLPEFGLTRGPDGWYLARSSGPFASDSSSQILRYPFGGGDAVAPDYFAALGSVSDFSYSGQYQLAFFVVDGDIQSASWSGESGWQAGPSTGALNTPGYEASPHMAPDGSLYFASQRAGGIGQGDIYRAIPEGDSWTIELLGPAINSPTGEWNLTLSPDGSMMVFEASGRPTNGTGSGDLYLSCNVGGEWQPAQPMVKLNTDGSDLDFRFLGYHEGVFSTAVMGGDAILRYAGPENFTACQERD